MLRPDRAGRYRLLPAQSELGRRLYVHYGLDPEDYETNILIEAAEFTYPIICCVQTMTSLRAVELGPIGWFRIIRKIVIFFLARCASTHSRCKFGVFHPLHREGSEEIFVGIEF